MGILRCPACREKFRWDLSTPFPDDCPICDVHIGSDRADDDICMPSIRKARSATKATDKIYRDMEKASEDSAYAAAEQAGVHVSDMMPTMKMTNMNDGMKQGDIAAPPLTGSAAALEQHMASMQQKGAQVGFGGQGLGYSAGSHQGPVPSAGARFQTAVNDGHSDMVARHCVGKDETNRPVIPSTDVRSTRPANELFQPGYNLRAGRV